MCFIRYVCDSNTLTNEHLHKWARVEMTDHFPCNVSTDMYDHRKALDGKYEASGQVTLPQHVGQHVELSQTVLFLR